MAAKVLSCRAILHIVPALAAFMTQTERTTLAEWSAQHGVLR
jgi:hypothetical protein